MMFFLTTSVLAISLAIDAFIVSVAIAAKHKKDLPLRWFLFIPFFFGAMQGIMPLIGWLVSESFYQYIVRYDHWIAFFLLTAIGINMLRNAGRDEDDNPKATLTLSTIVALGVATSIDALAVGFTLNTITAQPLLTIFSIFVITSVLCYFGFMASRKIPQSIANPSEFVAGLVLIFLAIKTVLTNLF